VLDAFANGCKAVNADRQYRSVGVSRGAAVDDVLVVAAAARSPPAPVHAAAAVTTATTAKLLRRTFSAPPEVEPDIYLRAFRSGPGRGSGFRPSNATERMNADNRTAPGMVSGRPPIGEFATK